MRRSASWMSIWDDRILEYLHKYESATPKELDESGLFQVSKSQISRRLQRLAEHGLVRNLGRGVYVITDEGEAYLNEKYDAEAGVYLEDGVGEEPSAGESGANGV